MKEIQEKSRSPPVKDKRASKQTSNLTGGEKGKCKGI